MRHQEPQKPKLSISVDLLWLGLVSPPTSPTKSLVESAQKLDAKLRELEVGG